MLKNLCLFFIAIMIAGCGTVRNRFGPETLPTGVPSSTMGVVVISTGAKDKCITASTFFKVLRNDQSYYKSEIGLLSVDAYPLKSDFSDMHGNVHALALPPGKYYLAPWMANPYVTAKKIRRFDFEVFPSEVTYLGNFYMSTQCVLTTFGEFTDQWIRDEEIIKEKNPTLKTSNVRKQILKPTGFAIENQ